MQLEEFQDKAEPFMTLLYPLMPISAIQSILLAFGKIDRRLGLFSRLFNDNKFRKSCKAPTGNS